MGSIASKCAEDDERQAWEARKRKEEDRIRERERIERFKKILSDFGYKSEDWLGGEVFTTERNQVFGVILREGKFYRSLYGNALKGMEFKTEEQLREYCDLYKKLDKARKKVEELEAKMHEILGKFIDCP